VPDKREDLASARVGKRPERRVHHASQVSDFLRKRQLTFRLLSRHPLRALASSD
jgi:hypothetical protein